MTLFTQCKKRQKKVKWSRYRPSVAKRVGRVIALLSHDRGTRRGWVVSSMPRPHFTPGKDPVPILQEAGWAPGPVWTGGKSRTPPGHSYGRQTFQHATLRLDIKEKYFGRFHLSNLDRHGSWFHGQSNAFNLCPQHAPAAFYPRERPGTHFTGGWVFTQCEFPK